MILDTSAIVAILADEPDAATFQEALINAASISISAVTVLETRIVLHTRYGEKAVQQLDEMLENSGITVVPFDGMLATAAFDAFRRFGKGQGHPAQLNIIDCAAYALAKIRSEALLFKGNDFVKTDILAAVRGGNVEKSL